MKTIFRIVGISLISGVVMQAGEDLWNDFLKVKMSKVKYYFKNKKKTES
jgi:hypothetical protein